MKRFKAVTNINIRNYNQQLQSVSAMPFESIVCDKLYITRYDDNRNEDKVKAVFSITEFYTGMALCYGETINKLMKTWEEILSKKDIDKMKETINQYKNELVKKYGYANKD